MAIKLRPVLGPRWAGIVALLALGATLLDSATATALSIVAIDGPAAALGDNWEITSSGGFFPTYFLQPTSPHTITITLSDGTVNSFEAQPNPASAILDPGVLEFGTLSFQSLPASSGTLFPSDFNPVEYILSTFGLGPTQLLSFDTVEPIDPLHLVFTTAAGLRFDIPDWRTGANAPVPEPPTLLLITSGLATIFLVRRRPE